MLVAAWRIDEGIAGFDGAWSAEMEGTVQRMGKNEEERGREEWVLTGGPHG